jgi:RNA polymerase sigma-70 factor, ECF subfamily
MHQSSPGRRADFNPLKECERNEFRSTEGEWNEFRSTKLFLESNVMPEPNEPWTGGWPQSRDQFAALVDAYADRLLRYAFRQLGNLEDAEDVVQDVMVRGFAERARRTEIGAVGPYLYRSVANACTDLRRRRNCSAVFREEVAVGDLVGGPAGPADAVQAAEELRRTESLLGRLPEEQAEAIRLRVFDGLRLGEVAEVTGCSINTVCSRLRYGFRRLRSMIGETGE